MSFRATGLVIGSRQNRTVHPAGVLAVPERVHVLAERAGPIKATLTFGVIGEDCRQLIGRRRPVDGPAVARDVAVGAVETASA